MNDTASPSTAALLADVLRDPDDDIARLLYADRLIAEENPRGEFIRLQCALAGRPDPGTRQEMTDRASALFKTHGTPWTAPFSDLRDSPVVFHRGFVNKLTVSAEKFLPVAEPILTAEPIVLFDLQVARVSSFTRLVSLPMCDRLKTLRLRSQLSDMTSVLTENFSQGRLPRLTNLNLARCDLEECDWSALARAAAGRAIASLTLTANEMGNDGLSALIESGFLARCTDLYLGSCELGDTGVIALASSPFIRGLRRLVLSGNEITDTGVRALAQSPNLRALQSLDLSNNRFKTPGIKDILASPYLQGLTSFSIGQLWGVDSKVMTQVRERFG